MLSVCSGSHRWIRPSSWRYRRQIMGRRLGIHVISSMSHTLSSPYDNPLRGQFWGGRQHMKLTTFQNFQLRRDCQRWSAWIQNLKFLCQPNFFMRSKQTSNSGTNIQHPSFIWVIQVAFWMHKLFTRINKLLTWNIYQMDFNLGLTKINLENPTHSSNNKSWTP